MASNSPPERIRLYESLSNSINVVSTNTDPENDDEETVLITKTDGENLVLEPSKPKDNKCTPWLVFALRFFLFSPIKWKRDGCWISVFHLVWFAVFIAKTCYLTGLTFQIGYCRETVYSSIEDGNIALHHNLLKHWDASFETLPYPPSSGKFAVYNQEDLRKRINYAVENVFKLEARATGYFKKLESDFVKIHLVYFDIEHNHAFHPSRRIVTNVKKSFEPHYGLSKYEDIYGNTLYSYNITEELDMLNISSSLDRMLCLNIMFSLHTLRVSRSYNDSRCQHIYGNITYFYMKDNYHDIYGESCHEDNLPWTEYFCNVKWWYIMSITGDVFTLMGVLWIVTTLGEESDFKQPLKEWDRNVVYIGSGCLLTWFSMLRFIKINHKFTLLFKTLKRSALDVIFFMTCVTIIFVGFLFCIYIVLGPYNVKFNKLSTTAETLFSLINGDEMFVSFEYLKREEAGDQQRIYLFSILIIFVFVIIFTVFVLNLLIALFNSAYEVVKNSYDQEKETEQTRRETVPKTLTYFMCKDFDESAKFDRCCGASLDGKKLFSHRCFKKNDDGCNGCTCGVFNTLVHFVCCNIFTICCCHCKATTK